MAHWIEKANIYHIYPLGFCGCERFRKDVSDTPKPRIKKIIEWIPHIKSLNMNTVYFGPVFESVEHGYDTNDYYTIDARLGSNADFKEVCEALHKNGIKIILDGVFNHVGRNHFAFEDLQRNGQSSQYRDWFAGVNFGGRSPYGDNFSYEGWNGYYNLVKLNLYNQNVVEHLFDAIRMWINEFKIDGIRFDVAYCLPDNFNKEICRFTKDIKSDFWLMGEVIHGDYGHWVNNEMFDSVTNYQCYKGNYSSHNDRNYFEIAHNIEMGISLKHYLYNFLDNHDVSRLTSVLSNPEHTECCYTMMYMMYGVPSVYYGSEWGLSGTKGNGTDADLVIRPELNLDDIKKGNSKLMSHIAALGAIRINNPAVQSGSYSKLELKNQTFLFMREKGETQIYIALNISDDNYTFSFMTKYTTLTDLLSGNKFPVSNGRSNITVPKNCSVILSGEDISIKIFEPQIIINTDSKPMQESVKHTAEPPCETIKKSIVLGGHYRHFKGGDYVVLNIAQNHETLEKQIVYMSLNDKPTVWVRPLDMFLEDINDNGNIKQRFQLIK